MGEVHLAVAQPNAAPRLFALKRLRADRQFNEAALQMLREEGRISGQLQHPNIVSVYDVLEGERGPALLMEYVEGVDLSKIARMLRARGRRLPVHLALDIVLQIARGLLAAHNLTDSDGTPSGVIHRDLSPHNVLVDFEGVVRITDFGIVHAVDREVETTTGVVKGKPAYLAPERLLFEKFDHRVDFFSLGVVLYELLCRERLYGGPDDARVCWRVINEPPPELTAFGSHIPKEAAELCRALLQKRASDRPADATEIIQRVQRAKSQMVGDPSLAEFMQECLREEWVRLRGLRRKALESITPPDAKPAASTRSPYLNSMSSSHLAYAALGMALAVGASVYGASKQDPSVRSLGSNTTVPQQAAVFPIQQKAKPTTAAGGRPDVGARSKQTSQVTEGATQRTHDAAESDPRSTLSGAGRVRRRARASAARSALQLSSDESDTPRQAQPGEAEGLWGWQR